MNFKNIYIYTCLLLFLFSNSLLSQPVINSDGYNTFYYSNGVKSSEGNMRAGKPVGLWKTYHKNGQLASLGNRKNFLLDSIWSFYNKSEILLETITYKNDIKNGKNTKYKDGLKYVTYYFKDGLIQDSAIYFYPSGNIFKIILFKDNLENGNGFEYAEDGRLITLMKYKDGFIRSREEINRVDINNKKYGLWRIYYNNGIVKEEGTYYNDEKNGIWKTYDKKESLEKIYKYINGIEIKDADETIMLDIRKEYYDNGQAKLVGGYKNNVKHGVFREYSKEGKLKQSYIYKNGELVAEGLIDNDGTYQGNWKIYYDNATLRAKGKYVNGEKDDLWIYYFSNGNIEQKGKYILGKPEGNWTWYYSNKNSHREENYKNGLEDGLSVEYDVDSSLIAKGEYFNGLKEGPWYYHMGDHTEQGNFIDNERDGIWQYYYDNDQLNFEGEFVNGFPNGKHRYYYRNGKVKLEGKYDMGFKQKDWKLYDELGVLLLTINYKNGIEKKYDGLKIKPQFEEVNQ